MRHGTRQLSGKRARHGAGHRRVAGFYSAAWPDIAPPLTRHGVRHLVLTQSLFVNGLRPLVIFNGNLSS